MLIFLVGFMGCGKSTAGRLAAESLDYNFIDLDNLIEANEGKSIKEIFDSEGENQFRVKEQQELEAHFNNENTIIATGGGLAAHGENMINMNKYGKTVYLKAHHGVLYNRLVKSKKNRPLISNFSDIDLMEYILNTLPKREIFYLKANKILETYIETKEELAENLVQEIKNFQSS